MEISFRVATPSYELMMGRDVDEDVPVILFS
jgi:hypothetical protein